MKTLWKKYRIVGLTLFLLAATTLPAQPDAKPADAKAAAAVVAAQNKACIECHQKTSPALVMEWKRSRHAEVDVACVDCHAANPGEPDAWTHEGVLISALVTPKDCAQCHEVENDQFARSHHARGGEILASLDNVLAEKVAGMPGNIADAVNGCWQCHGSIVKFKRDANGEILRAGKEGKPVVDPDTWPNSGIGRLNPDGSKGSCHACHSRHSFEAKLSRSPENCGKCHLGPDHPQIEVYNESKHGIAFHANRDKMALDKASWVLGKDYSAAPTCATCHVSSYLTTNGVASANSHDVGDRLSWTLRPVISTKLNLVVFADGFKEDYPETKALPKIGDEVNTTEKVVEHEALVDKPVKRKVADIVTWQQRRDKMKGACLNCHGNAFVDNFYKQFDSLVVLYNEKFARPAQKIMDELTADGALNPKAPFEHEVQWVFWELWHHEGRRARHGASMMGPDYTHWHGMYEVSKHFYEKFLPAVVEAAKAKSPALGRKWEGKVRQLLTQEEHRWLNGLSPQEVEALQKSYKERYNQ
jgi:hydroxylamine dehydrogenase